MSVWHFRNESGNRSEIWGPVKASEDPFVIHFIARFVKALIAKGTGKVSASCGAISQEGDVKTCSKCPGTEIILQKSISIDYIHLKWSEYVDN